MCLALTQKVYSVDITPLSLEHIHPWADLLAVSFRRSMPDMLALLDWLHSGWRVIACGAWDKSRLAAQYTCLLTDLYVPDLNQTVKVGISWNMAVHPGYRGRGLIKQVSKPVYEMVQAAGGVAGMGFSNAEGVQVDRKSKGYGYQVAGQMTPAFAWMRGSSDPAFELHDTWTDISSLTIPCSARQIHLVVTLELLYRRYACHPFRQYRYGIWREDGQVIGIVIYRRAQVAGIPAATLLAAYSADLPGLLSRWGAAMRWAGIHFAHVLTSPRSHLKQALRQAAWCVDLPYARSPYYLTVKPMDAALPASFTQFSAWDCVGGDIL